ncbi:MAG: hypothetical protein AAF228_01975 [Pseudomonadota bacterium]
MILNLPWIIVAFLFYNGVALFAGYWGSAPDVSPADVSPADIFQKTELFSIVMLSEIAWVFTLGDCVLLVALLALFVEILKATQTRSLAILDHGLSVVVFIICLIEFLLVDIAGTSLFFFITVIALIDVIAGFSVGIRAAKRDFNVGG